MWCAELCSCTCEVDLPAAQPVSSGLPDPVSRGWERRETVRENEQLAPSNGSNRSVSSELQRVRVTEWSTE